MENFLKSLKSKLHHEATPGVLLMVAMIAALIVANSGVKWYGAMLETIALVGIGEWTIQKPLLLWINDGLMAVFFLMVGLELKREVLFGELSDKRKIALPIFAATGGICGPAAIYAFINWGDPIAMNGWAIPAATDIAFALGVLALLGSRVPVSLKILLTSVAVIDDLAAIIIIALFYTSQLSVTSLWFAFLALVGLFTLNRFKVRTLTPYMLVGLFLWIAVLKSGGCTPPWPEWPWQSSFPPVKIPITMRLWHTNWNMAYTLGSCTGSCQSLLLGTPASRSSGCPLRHCWIRFHWE